MRNVFLATTLVLAGAGMHALADSDAGDDGARAGWAVADRLRALELEVDILQARESALSSYVAANAKRADGLEALANRCREQGFAARALPAESRETLLAGIEALAKSLRKDLPLLTEEDIANQAAVAKFLEQARSRAQAGAPRDG